MIRIKNKKASLEVKEILELVLAAGGIFLLLLLLWSLLAPTFNKDKETAKSYLNSLKQAIAEADEKKVAVDFSLWGGEPKMVYFGDEKYVVSGSDTFFRARTDKNYLCFCYEKKGWKCEDCVSLKLSAVFEPSKQEPVFEEGTYFKIEKKPEEKPTSYVFSYEIRK